MTVKGAFFIPLALWGIAVSATSGQAAIAQRPVSLACQEVSLADCAAELKKNHGISVDLGSHSGEAMLHLDMTGAPLRAALAKMIRQSGVTDYAIVFSEKNMLAQVKVLAAKSDKPEVKAQPGPAQGLSPDSDPPPPFAPPPEGVEVSGPPGDPLDQEVIPPSEPGGKGVTLREVLAAQEASNASGPPGDPMDREVIPPSSPGGKGVTLREVLAAEEAGKSSGPSGDPLDQEVIPPSSPGGKGVTLREIQAAQQGAQAPTNEPPGSPPGMSGPTGGQTSKPATTSGQATKPSSGQTAKPAAGPTKKP